MFLDLGEQPLADNFLTKEQLNEYESKYPLQVYFCHECTLVQLGHVVPPEVLYNEDYPYETGLNRDGKKHFNLMAIETISRFNLKYSDVVIDIGSNDGTLLSGFQRYGCKVIGIEPVKKIADKAQVPTINSFFDSKLVPKLPKAKVITATNVVAHIDNLHEFARNVYNTLRDDGVLIIEAPYIDDLVNGLAFDTIYHEHLSYFGVYPLKFLFDQHDMVIVDAEWYPVHGGSMRYYVKKKPQSAYLLKMGDDMTLERLRQLAYRTQEFKREFRAEIYTLYAEGRKIVGVSAPAKGNTLLNHCKVNILEYITEVSKKKIGKYTPGTRIPIVQEEKIIKDQPDYAVILAWNWAEPIAEKLIDMGYKGGFIIPNGKKQQDFDTWLKGPRGKLSHK